MSVNFSLAREASAPSVHVHGCDGTTEDYSLLRFDYASQDPPMMPCDGSCYDVGIANGNFGLVAPLLDIEGFDGGHPCGHMTGDEMKERVLVALARLSMAPSYGMKEAVVYAGQGATIYSCGRDETYVPLRLQGLLLLAEEASRQNVNVVWG